MGIEGQRRRAERVEGFGLFGAFAFAIATCVGWWLGQFLIGMSGAGAGTPADEAWRLRAGIYTAIALLALASIAFFVAYVRAAIRSRRADG